MTPPVRPDWSALRSGVSYAMMTHPSRADALPRILAQLDRECDIFVDRAQLGPWSPARRAWEATPPDCAFRCLLQDDIDLAPGFAEMLEWLVTLPELRDRPLSLCNVLKERAVTGSSWVERRDGVHGPCLVLAQHDVGAMLTWVATHVRDSMAFMYDDIRVSLWLEAQQRTALWPDPSWVQHRGWEPSLIGTRSSKSAPRTAPSFTGAPLSATDWRLGLTDYRSIEPDPALEAHIVGRPLGASFRVRNRLWRTAFDRTDEQLSRDAGSVWPPPQVLAHARSTR